MQATTWVWMTAALAPITHAKALSRSLFAPCMHGQPKFVPSLTARRHIHASSTG